MPITKSDDLLSPKKPKKLVEGETPAEVPATVTEASPSKGWVITAKVELSNGQFATRAVPAESEPDNDARNAHLRQSIELFRAALPAGISFDNSAVSLTVTRV